MVKRLEYVENVEKYWINSWQLKGGNKYGFQTKGKISK